MKYLLLLSLFTTQVQATTLKVAILAPEGTTWADTFKEMTNEIKEKTEGRVKHKIYYGGVAGDENDVLRKIRIKQFHGALFSGRTLGDINGDSRHIEVPFQFGSDRASAWKTVELMTPFYNQGFEKNGFINLGIFEIGNIYLASTKKVTNLVELRRIKVWNWAGDPIAESMVNSLKLVGVPLPITEVLSSLSTGIIEGAYGSALSMLAMQWSSKVKYFLDFPITFSIAAYLVDKKIWKKIKPTDQKVVLAVAKKYVDKANSSMVSENNEAMKAMLASGIELTKVKDMSGVDMPKLQKEIFTKLQGKSFSKLGLKKFKQAKAAALKKHSKNAKNVGKTF